MQYKFVPIYVGVAVAMLIAANASHADMATDQTQSNAAEIGGLEEITVTATRREQNLQDVAITVNAVTADALANAQIHSSADLPQLVPNLTISSQVGAWVVYLRGVGQLATNAGQEPSVATYVDGVYQPNGFSALLSLADVERVEVVKGPQGTLFGRNATGGLINVVTRDPSHQSSGMVEASYGNFDTYKFSGYGTTGLTDKAAIDFSAYVYDQSHGFGTNVTTHNRVAGTETVDIRSKLLFEPGDTTKIRVSASYTDNRSGQGNDLAVLPGSVAVTGVTALPGFYDVQNNVDPLNSNATWQGSARIDQQLASYFDLVSISSYTHTHDHETEDATAVPTPLITAILTQRSETFTQEFQAVTKKDMPVTGILGLYFFHQLAAGEPTGTGLYGLAFGGPDSGEQGRAHLLTNSYAAYAEGTYAIVPKLDFTLGARYTHDEKSLTGGLDSVAAGAIVGTTPFAAQSQSWGDPTYRAMLGYHVTDSVLAYALYSRGFKSGGFDTSGLSTAPVAYQPETVDDYEVGFKTELFDRHLRLNVAYFYYNYKELQLPVLVPGPNGSIDQVTLNATNATIKGLDLDGALQVNQMLGFNFGLGTLDSKYSNFPNAPCTSRVAGATVQAPCDVSGRELSHAPKVTGNLGGNFAVPTAMGKWGVSINYSFMTQFFYDVADRLAQGGYGILNGEFSWTDLTDKYHVGLYGENLANKEFTVAQFAQPGLGDSYVAGNPRMYGIRVRVKF
jgi:iron complex outermembrane receptor protein